MKMTTLLHPGMDLNPSSSERYCYVWSGMLGEIVEVSVKPNFNHSTMRENGQTISNFTSNNVLRGILKVIAPPMKGFSPDESLDDVEKKTMQEMMKEKGGSVVLLHSVQWVPKKDQGRPSSSIFDHMIIPLKSIARLSMKSRARTMNRSSSLQLNRFAVDGDVGGARREVNRDLKVANTAWLPSAEETDATLTVWPPPASTDSSRPYDQFKTNLQKFDHKSTYTEELYTTALDLTDFDNTKISRAEALAKEIDSTSVHKGRFVGDDNEEAKYGAVLGTGNFIDWSARGTKVEGGQAVIRDANGQKIPNRGTKVPTYTSVQQMQQDMQRQPGRTKPPKILQQPSQDQPTGSSEGGRKPDDIATLQAMADAKMDHKSGRHPLELEFHDFVRTLNDTNQALTTWMQENPAFHFQLADNCVPHIARVLDEECAEIYPPLTTVGLLVQAKRMKLKNEIIKNELMNSSGHIALPSTDYSPEILSLLKKWAELVTANSHCDLFGDEAANYPSSTQVRWRKTLGIKHQYSMLSGTDYLFLDKKYYESDLKGNPYWDADEGDGYDDLADEPFLTPLIAPSPFNTVPAGYTPPPGQATPFMGGFLPPGGFPQPGQMPMMGPGGFGFPPTLGGPDEHYSPGDDYVILMLPIRDPVKPAASTTSTDPPKEEERKGSGLAVPAN